MIQPKIRDRRSTLQRLRTISHVLDNAIPIPGTRYRIGIDPIMGLLPGVGDIAGAVLSAYIVFEAARFGLPQSVLTQMLINLVADSTLGALPVVGDFFDAAWKANSRNLALLETHTNHPDPPPAADRKFIILLMVLLALIVFGVAAIATLIVSLVFQLMGGQ